MILCVVCALCGVVWCDDSIMIERVGVFSRDITRGHDKLDLVNVWTELKILFFIFQQTVKCMHPTAKVMCPTFQQCAKHKRGTRRRVSWDSSFGGRLTGV